MVRPRSVTKEEALERALLVFWARGYARTSIADLSAAIGVGPSSIYSTFGSKEALFRDAIGLYMQTYAAPALQQIAGDRGRGAVAFVRGLMRTLVRLYTTPGLPQGCALFQSGGVGTPQESPACATTHGFKVSLRDGIRGRLEACAAGGETLAAPPRTLALFVVAALRGVSQAASDGASRAELLKVADHTARSCVADD